MKDRMQEARKEKKMPVQFQTNVVWKIPKANGKPGCKGMGLVRAVRTMGKALHRARWEVQENQAEAPRHCFSVKGKRREEAIAIQLCMPWKLKKE